MRMRTRFTFLVVLNVLVLAVFALHGCTRTTIRFHVDNTTSLQTVEGDLDFATTQVKETDEALDELKVSPKEDLRTAYRDFAKEVDLVGMVGERLVRHVDGMHDIGVGYFVRSEKSVTECRYPRLSENAGTQPLQLGEAFDPIYQSSKTVRNAYRAYYFDVSNIRDQLSRNLTPKGVESMEILFRKAKVDSESLTVALNEALAAVREAKPMQGDVPSQDVPPSPPEGVPVSPPESVPPSPPEGVPASPPEGVPPSPPE